MMRLRSRVTLPSTRSKVQVMEPTTKRMRATPPASIQAPTRDRMVGSIRLPVDAPAAPAKTPLDARLISTMPMMRAIAAKMALGIGLVWKTRRWRVCSRTFIGGPFEELLKCAGDDRIGRVGAAAEPATAVHFDQ